ncbi:quinon protein alcohol dehydrogenase-like superfamily [Lanmaoa asiatica]|nr:quinon protein alcohol dehydrogenase-like superfamily [Lanmaoa asiatica]
MDAGSEVSTIAVSQCGKWVVSGTKSGWVTVWNAKSHEKVTEFKGHGREVCAVDISPDSTRIATGSNDKTVSVWSLSTGQRLLGRLAT